MWDRACRERFSGDVYGQRRNFEPEMQELEAALKETRWVIVESAEWESGLD